jgi:hypothetical protein
MSSRKKVEIQNPMRRAFEDGCDGYIPTFRGVSLDPEGADPAASLKNLNLILPVCKVTKVEVGPNQNVLVTFATGEMYLALGFKIGDERGDGQPIQDVKSFAGFLSRAGLGDYDAILNCLLALPPDYEGSLDPILWTDSRPRLVADYD